MCGRYAMYGPVSLSREAKAAADDMGIVLEGLLDQREPLYNIAPTQTLEWTPKSRQRFKL